MKIQMSFLRGFLYGLYFFPPHRYKRKRKIEKVKRQLNKVKNQLDRGFEIDRENISNDWKNVCSDINYSYNKLLNLN